MESDNEQSRQFGLDQLGQQGSDTSSWVADAELGSAQPDENNLLVYDPVVSGRFGLRGVGRLSDIIGPQETQIFLARQRKVEEIRSRRPLSQRRSLNSNHLGRNAAIAAVAAPDNEVQDV